MLSQVDLANGVGVVRILFRAARLDLGQDVVGRVDQACCRHHEESNRSRFRHVAQLHVPKLAEAQQRRWPHDRLEKSRTPGHSGGRGDRLAMKGDEERIREGGCEAYLSKPISVPKFIETIRRFLGVGLSMPAVSRSRQAEMRRRHVK
jgi:hypothetical protein